MKQTEQISITRALNELKLLDKRIEKTILSSKFLTLKINEKNQDNDFKPKENLQSINDLIKRRSLMKSKIMESNAETEVTIAGTKMTVVEAIELKDSIKYKKKLLEKLVKDCKSTRASIENINSDVKERLDVLLQSHFGKDAKVKDSDTEAIIKPFMNMNEAKEVDLINIDNIIISLTGEIDSFESEVDFILSESNAITKIEI